MKAQTKRIWDDRYLVLAAHIADWSKDPKAKVGAVLLNSRGWPIALGYNGFPKGVEDDINKLKDGGLKNEMVVHAEQNALLCAGTESRDGSLYVFGKPVCPRCAALVIQAGVTRVIALQPEPRKNPGSDTHTRGIISLSMFKEAKVAFDPIEIPSSEKDLFASILEGNA